jgi:hypothetical protein
MEPPLVNKFFWREKNHSRFKSVGVGGVGQCMIFLSKDIPCLQKTGVRIRPLKSYQKKNNSTSHEKNTRFK